jgi:hypothetical protein
LATHKFERTFMSDKTNPKLKVVNDLSNSEAIFREAMDSLKHYHNAIQEKLSIAKLAHKISHGYKGRENDYKAPDAYEKKIKCAEAEDALNSIQTGLKYFDESIDKIYEVKLKQ